MVLGARICALRASDRITSASGFGGWPTPQVDSFRSRSGDRKGEMGLDQLARSMSGWPTPQAKEQHDTPEKMKARGMATGLNLTVAAHLTGWPTPVAKKSAGGATTDPDKVLARVRGNHANDLQDFVQLVAGWATPTVQDSANNAGPSQWDRNSKPLNVEAVAYISDAPTEKSERSRPTAKASLNPYFSLWLIMGQFAIAWGYCGERVIRSRPNSQRSSSRPTKKH